MSELLSETPTAPRRKPVEAHWISYANGVLPQGCSEMQFTECRAAFYAGAAAFYAILMGGLDDSSEASDADLGLMDDLYAELLAFGNSGGGLPEVESR